MKESYEWIVYFTDVMGRGDSVRVVALYIHDALHLVNTTCKDEVAVITGTMRGHKLILGKGLENE